MTFRESITEINDTQILEYNEYNEAIRILESKDYLNEGFMDNLTSGITKKIEFIKQVANTSKAKLEDILILFKDKKVFKFFKTIAFSFTKLFGMLKNGYKGYIKLQKVISEYVASQKVVKWTKDKLDELDIFLQKHPTLKAISGIVVSGILLYIWLNMSFGGDLAFDMNFDDILLALGGKFTLSELFAGEDGIRMLLLFATGTMMGLSFPWPGATSVQLVSGVIFSLSKFVKSKIKVIKHT